MQYAIAVHTIDGQPVGYHNELFNDGLDAESKAEEIEQRSRFIVTIVVPWEPKEGSDLLLTT